MRALSAFRPGTGSNISLTLFCKPPKIGGNSGRYNTLGITFSLLNRHEPGKDIVKTISAQLEPTKLAHWEVEEFASWDSLKTNLETWAKNDSFLFECQFVINEL